VSAGWQVAVVSLWAVVIAQTALLLVLYRQVGLVFLGQSSARSRDGLRVGSVAPEWQAVDQFGAVHDLDDYRGTPLLLVFAEPGCGPCQKLFPELRTFSEEHRDAINVVSVGSDNELANRSAANKFGLDFPVLTQHRQTISTSYKVVATPFAYVIDEDGVVREKGIVNTGAQVHEKLAVLGELRLREGVGT
jgi:methylamine dehydrogenase accessory protein MauD